MRVAHIITTIDLGGAEKQLLILANEQKKLGLHVEVFALKGLDLLKGSFESLGIQVITKHNWVRFYASLLNFVFRNRKESKQIVHCHLPRSEIVGALLKLCNKRLNLIITRHNCEPFFPRYPRISGVLSRFVTANAEVIAISRAVKDFLQTKLEIADDKEVFVIHYGVITSYVGSKEILKPKCAKLRIGTLARLVPQKNLEVLLEACHSLPKDLDWELKIGGEGLLAEILRSKSKDLGISDKVNWLGVVNDSRNFFSNIDLFILPSLYEGFGLVLLEAMQNKICIIGSDAEAIVEVLGEDYPNIFRRTNARQLAVQIVGMKDWTTRSRIVSKYPQMLEAYDAHAMAGRTIEVYKGAKPLSCN